MKTNNDDNILTGFKQGDERAVKQIFERFHNELVHFATRITGNRYEAQDIVVEAFLKILPRAKDFTSLENIRAFLYVVVRHACFAWVEKQSGLQKKEQAFAYLQDIETSSEPLMDKEEMIARTIQQLYEFIQQLPPQEKKVFILKVIKQRSADEIAEELNISKKTVYNLTSAAISRLRSLVGRSSLPMAIMLYVNFFHFFSNQQEF
ncbi:MAG: RNA polymerase sigma factor [Chitinophagaceae bacterium]|nr:RNA polymerase sigma factor [Chitinophagaceae bacterium]